MSDQTDLEKFYPLQEVELADPNERKKLMKRKAGRFELSDEAKAWGKSSSAVPDSVKRYMSRKHDTGPEMFEYFTYAARLMRAEAEVKLAARFLAEVDGELTDVAEANKNAIQASSEVKRIAQERDRLQEEVLRLKSLPSMAVFSED